MWVRGESFLRKEKNKSQYATKRPQDNNNQARPINAEVDKTQICCLCLLNLLTQHPRLISRLLQICPKEFLFECNYILTLRLRSRSRSSPFVLPIPSPAAAKHPHFCFQPFLEEEGDLNGLPGHASKCNGVVKSPESRFPPPHVATRKYEGGIYTWTSQGRENNHFWDASCVRSSLGSSSVTQGQAPRRSPACSTRSRFILLPCASERPTDR